MGEALVQGLLTGWAIAVPVGAVGALLVAVTARTSFRTGAAGALGVATVDGGCAALAVVGGAAVASALEPAADALRVVAAAVLLGVALVIARAALRATGSAGEAPRGWAPRPAAAYAAFVGLTAVNPTTVVYFAAIVLGNRDLVAGPAAASVFVAAAFAASASWQLTLAGGGAALGAAASGPRGRRVTGLASAVVVGGLAGWTVLG